MSKTRMRKTRRNASNRRAVNGEQVRFEWNERFSLILVSVIGCLHICGLAALFNPASGIFNTQPLIDQDWGLHFHHLNSLAAFWHQDKMTWGYNPFFMAGYPSNTIQDLSIKFFEWTALALSAISLSPVQWLKICAFLAMASVPWLMYTAASNLFFGDESKCFIAALAASFGTVYWWNSLPREMFFYGMIGFPVASYLSIWGISLFYRLALFPTKIGSSHFALLIFVAAALPLHVQSMITFLPPMFALLLLRPQLITARLLAWSTATAFFALLVNSAWLIPAIHHRADDVSAAIVERLPLFVGTGAFTFLLDYLGPRGFWTFRSSVLEKGFRLMLLILGTAGIWHLIRSPKRPIGMMLATASVVLFGVTYFGALSSTVKAWQPLRFKVPLDLILVIAASYYASLSFGRSRSFSPFVGSAVVLGLLAFSLNVIQTESSGRLKLRSTFRPELTAIVEWIDRETPENARLLFEESGDESGFVYDRTYLSSFLPYLTGRQLIGGPINLYNDRHHFAEFHSGKLFQKDPQAISDSELRNYLRLYNIGAVVAFDPRSIQRLLSIPGLVTVEQRIGPVHLMKVNQPLSWFIAGEGKLKAGYNRLELSELKGDELILKYHWVAGLTAEPLVRMEPVHLADDPIPFIKLIHPPSALKLRVAPS
jgi:hypothetical protein